MPSLPPVLHRIRTHHVVLPVAVLVLGIVGTAGGTAAVSQAVSDRADERLAARVDTVTATVTAEVRRHTGDLTQLAAAVGAQSTLTATDLDVITGPVAADRPAGAATVSLVVPADDSEVASVQRSWRAAGTTDLTLRPVPTFEHRFVVLSRALEGPPDTLGRDTSATSEVLAALTLSRRSGEVTVSAPLVLAQDRALAAARRSSSVVLVAPLPVAAPVAGRRADLRGWVTMAVRGDAMLAALLDTTGPDLHVTLADVTSAGSDVFAAGSPVASPDPGRRATRELDVAGRRWALTLTPSTTSAASATPERSALGGGLGLTLLVTALTAGLARQRDRALRVLAHRTSDLREDIERREAVEAQLRAREAELEGFAAVAAHDLLTPLTAVTGYTELAQDHVGGSDPELAGWLSRVRAGSERMRILIESLLAYSTAEDPRLHVEDVDLDRVVAEVIAARTDQMTVDRPHIDATGLPQLVGDPVLLAQVLEQLLDNALTYTRHGHAAQVTVTAERAAESWCVTVADRGIGIPAGDHRAVFGAFARAPGSEGYAGSGLGLAICERIVVAHGGHIWAEPAPGGGTRVTFTVPDREPGTVAAMTPGQQFPRPLQLTAPSADGTDS